MSSSAGTSSPIADTLRRVGRFGTEYELVVSPVGDDWVPAAELIGGGPVFEDAIGISSSAVLPSARRAIGSQLVVAYLRFAWPAVTAYALERRVPDVSAANLLVRLGPDGQPVGFGLAAARFAALAGDPAAGSADFVAATDGALLAWLSERAIDANAADLIETVRNRLHTSGTALWGNVAAAFVHPLLWHVQVAATDADRAVRDAEAILDGRGEGGGELARHVRLLRVVHAEREWTVPARRTCCLSWSVPGGSRCNDCPLLREPEAAEFLRARLSEAVARGEVLRREVAASADAVSAEREATRPA
jgi:ferric iron reductase protein FhuF